MSTEEPMGEGWNSVAENTWLMGDPDGRDFVWVLMSRESMEATYGYKKAVEEGRLSAMWEDRGDDVVWYLFSYAVLEEPSLFLEKGVYIRLAAGGIAKTRGDLARYMYASGRNKVPWGPGGVRI